MQLPKVSILIPTYKQENFIKKAITSALQQDYKNLEIIVSDDDPTSCLKETIEEYFTDARFNYYKNEKNLGRVGNYKKSLYKYATGEWIVNLDADDYFINPEFIKIGIDEIIKAGSNNILFFQGAALYKSEFTEKVMQPRIEDETVIINALKYVYDFFEIDHFSHLTTLYNKTLALHSGFYETNIFSADLYSILKLAITNDNKNIILCRKVFGVWWQHGHNISKSLRLITHLQNFNAYTKLYRLLKHKSRFKIRPTLWYVKALYNYWGTYLSNVRKTYFKIYF